MTEQQRIEAMVKARQKKSLEYAYTDMEAIWSGQRQPLGYVDFINARAAELRAEREQENQQIKKVA